MTSESQTTEDDSLSPNVTGTYDFEDLSAGLRALGFATWRPTAPSRKMDLLARHPDGTIIRVRKNKRLIVEFDYSNCDRFKNDATTAKPVVVEISRSKNWSWPIYVWYFRAACKVRSAIKHLRLRHDTPNQVATLEPIYTEPPNSEVEWRVWGL